MKYVTWAWHDAYCRNVWLYWLYHYLQTVAPLQALTSAFSFGHSFFRDCQQIIYSTTEDVLTSTSPNLSHSVPSSAAAAEAIGEHLWAKRQNGCIYLYNVQFHSAAYVLHAVYLMILTGSESWHQLQSWICSIPAQWADNLSRWSFCLSANHCQIVFPALKLWFPSVLPFFIHH